MSYLLSAGLLQSHTQAARVLLVVGDELSQRCEGDLIRHKVRADGRALDPEVVHLPLAASCHTEEVVQIQKRAQLNQRPALTEITSPVRSF